MGVLDDAIREHLELKRRHGASEGEVTQKEQEALGPARRKPAEPVEGQPAEEPAAAEAEPVPAEPEPIEPEPIEPDLAEPGAVEPEPQEPEIEWEEPAAGDTPPRGFEQAREERPADEGGAEEDVLEETPEFLQETPEHDRLWFEQKPPREFDFDDE